MKKVHRFLFPQRTLHWLRMVVAVVVTIVVTKYWVIPIKAVGKSMENRVSDGSWYLAYRLPFLLKFRELDYGDIALVKFHSDSVVLLKRVVGKPGDIVAFKNGRLIRNGEEVEESYVKGPCDWNLEERTVKFGHVYVVGDNRSLSMKGHVFGQTREKNVKGVVLW